MLHNFYFPSSGKMSLNLSNDYLFHILLQEDKIVRSSLAFTLLGIEDTVGTCVQLQNPIIAGNNYTGKHLPVDLIVMLNDGKIINLEIEFYYDPHHYEYCFSYLCRPFEPLHDSRPHFNILPTLNDCRKKISAFASEKVFRETFTLINNHGNAPFSDTFSYSVLHLNQIQLAEESDIDSGLVQWMEFLKATKWEDVNSLAAVNPTLEHAADCIYVYYKNTSIYYACKNREETLDKIHSVKNIS